MISIKPTSFLYLMREKTKRSISIIMATVADAKAEAPELPESRANDAKFWRAAWRNPKVPGAFSNASYFLKGLHKWAPARNRLPDSLRQLQQALSRDDGYQTARVLRRRFERRPDVALYFNEKWEADLGHCGDRYRYLVRDKSHYFLLCVDLFSKKFFAEPLRDKTVKTTADAWDRIMARLSPPYGVPTVLETDRGGEFRGEFATRVRARGTELKVAEGSNKARCAERGIRSFKKVLTPLVEGGTHNFAAAIATTEAILNRRENRVLGCAPDEVVRQWRRIRALHLKHMARPPWQDYARRQRKVLRGAGVRERAHTWRVGDLVRVPFPRKILDKESDRQFRYQIFRIRAIIADRKPYLYALEEWLGNEDAIMRSQLNADRLTRYYYAAELRPAYPPTWHPISRLWRRRRGEALVSFMDYPPKFDRWVPSADVSGHWRV